MRRRLWSRVAVILAFLALGPSYTKETGAGATLKLDAAATHEAHIEETLRPLIATGLVHNPVANEGSSARLHQAFARAASTGSLAVTYVGGSVTACHLTTPAECWPTHVSTWLRTHVLALVSVNAAIPASTSSLSALCDVVPHGSDIVFVEFDVNDVDAYQPTKCFLEAWMDCPIRHGYERLVRHILALPNSPAVVIVHWGTPGWSQSMFHQQLWWQALEEQTGSVAKYYDIPSVSFRNAFRSLIDANATGFQERDYLANAYHPNALGHRYLAHAVLRLLKRAFTTHALAVQPAASPEDQQEQRPEGAAATAERQAVALIKPLFPANGRDTVTFCQRNTALQGLSAELLHWRWVDGDKDGFVADSVGARLSLRLPRVPKPYVKRYLQLFKTTPAAVTGLSSEHQATGVGSGSQTPARAAATAAAAIANNASGVATTSPSQGAAKTAPVMTGIISSLRIFSVFRRVANAVAAPPPATPATTAGVIPPTTTPATTTTPAAVPLPPSAPPSAPTAPTAPPAPHGALNATLHLGVLISRWDMGIAHVRCFRGCSCALWEIDATGASFISQQHLLSHAVLLDLLGGDPPMRCLITVKVIPRTRSKHHHFKVLSVALELPQLPPLPRL